MLNRDKRKVLDNLYARTKIYLPEKKLEHFFFHEFKLYIYKYIKNHKI